MNKTLKRYIKTASKKQLRRMVKSYYETITIMREELLRQAENVKALKQDRGAYIAILEAQAEGKQYQLEDGDNPSGQFVFTIMTAEGVVAGQTYVPPGTGVMYPFTELPVCADVHSFVVLAPEIPKPPKDEYTEALADLIVFARNMPGYHTHELTAKTRALVADNAAFFFGGDDNDDPEPCDYCKSKGREWSPGCEENKGVSNVGFGGMERAHVTTEDLAPLRDEIERQERMIRLSQQQDLGEGEG